MTISPDSSVFVKIPLKTLIILRSALVSIGNYEGHNGSRAILNFESSPKVIKLNFIVAKS